VKRQARIGKLQKMAGDRSLGTLALVVVYALLDLIREIVERGWQAISSRVLERLQRTNEGQSREALASKLEQTTEETAATGEAETRQQVPARGRPLQFEWGTFPTMKQTIEVMQKEML
jgi:hypothetical protein